MSEHFHFGVSQAAASCFDHPFYHTPSAPSRPTSRVVRSPSGASDFSHTVEKLPMEEKSAAKAGKWAWAKLFKGAKR